MPRPQPPVQTRPTPSAYPALPPPRQGNPLLRLCKRLFTTLVVLWLAFHVWVGAMLMVWQTQPINNTMFMTLHRLSGGAPVSQTWVEDSQISVNVKRAAIASEDANFANHAGFDVQGIEQAIKKNQKAGAISAGGSTISQQLAKNLFLYPKRSYIRKGEEALITVMIEQLWSKARILTAYLNVAEFGDGIYGIEAAAQHYFNCPAKNLTKRQAAFLVAMLPNPKYYQAHPNDRRLQAKTQIILRRMGTADLPDRQ